MAWTGTPVITSLGKYIVRISGMTLAGGASATIGLAGGSGDISLPSSFPSASDASGLTLADLVEVSFQRYNMPSAEATHIHCQKSNSPFLISLSNDTANSSGTMDIYVRYHHSLVR